MTRALRAGNNCPQAMTPSFDWMREFNYEGNLLIFVNTHSDTKTGNLVVSGNEKNPMSIPIYELLSKYIGDHNLRAATHAISAINKKAGVGPCIRGLVICACGSTGRLDDSALLLTRFVKEDIFDFVLTFLSVSTMDPVVVPALNRFIENVYVYGLQMWDALEESFGEDRHALNQSPVFLSFAEMKTNGDKVRQRTVHTRVLAYSNLRDGRPWGLDIYRCLSAACNAPAYNIIFHPHGKQYYGKQWVQTKIKYECLECGVVQKAISCPPWIHAARSQNYGRVWYEWPLSAEHKRDIGIIC
ncbi:uncharacterized protein F5891DRAFT_156716 [Suillus fuscotomentosus]|uniref:Uncharacterized protein n=1 Tax=Suillus fuscotomentosus TaxID=1912939 RepID=A0AAD4HCP3_9AGAM|nr:uncharacterized protein F5891DRAFT_156716 [Suillus fuscotomentosus]KAG1888975.1 hypothetical protein F5891DRAFT_156716 [Suillus fuscotomentosus]